MWLFYLLLVIIGIMGVAYFWQNIRPEINTRRNLSLLGKEAPMLTQDGIAFRDLNKNGKLDLYEDPRRPIEERVEDLLRQMTLEEKAGMLFQTMIGMNKDGTILEKTGMFPLPQTSDMIARRLMNYFNILEGSDPRHMAEWHNRTQKLAEMTGSGIPVTISSDPRHAFSQESAGEHDGWKLLPVPRADRTRRYRRCGSGPAIRGHRSTGISGGRHPPRSPPNG